MSRPLVSAPAGPGSAPRRQPAERQSGGTFLPSAYAPSSEEPMDHHLNARLCLNALRSTVTIDIRGRLTSNSQETLSGIIDRIRQLRARTSIHVLLCHAAFVDPAALAELRTAPCPTVTYIRRNTEGAAQTVTGAAASSQVTLAAASTGDGPRTPRLVRSSTDDLLSASDFIFAWLDDENGCPGTDVPEMIARYELIGQEISARNTDPSPPNVKGRIRRRRPAATPAHPEHPSASVVPPSRIHADAKASQI